MWEVDFSKNNSEVVIAVVEKEKCLNDLESVVGRFTIKETADFEKTKRKQSSNFMSFGNNNQMNSKMINDYGSYIYMFPNADMNKKKILRFFDALPNSQHF